MIDSFSQWCAEFVEQGVCICAEAVSDYTSSLTAAETDMIASSVAIRKNTYSTGRHCAKSALAELGIAPDTFAYGLLRKQDGAVDWPQGVVGSISHTNDWAVAAVRKSDERNLSIGVDIERIDRVERKVLRLIATDQEREAIEANLDCLWDRVALFSIKESLYKCLRPIYGEFIGFKDVRLVGLDTPANFDKNQTLARPGVEVYSPRVELLLPKLIACCDEKRIAIRLAVLPTHVLSFVSYHA